MRPTQIRAHLRREPFRAVRIHISDGSHYDVYHPEMALVTATEIAIALETTAGELPQRMVYCDPLHITRIEPLNGKKSKSSNKPA